MRNSDLSEYLQNEKKRLNKIAEGAEKRLRKAPEGSVRIIKHRDGYQFYFRGNPTEKSGTYMPVSQKQKGIALIQKKYDQQVVTAAGKQSRVIGRFLKDYNPDALKEIYASSSEGRKGYIDPVELPDSDYAKQWLNYEYQKKAFLEDDPEHYTSNGERVRSKSEVMIADTLKRIGIPYRYECPISLGGTIVYPDFTILRTSDRRELYWEHLGMMDNAAYCQTALKKIRLYESFKVFPGTTLILTMETSLTPINISVIAGVIQEYCI